MHKMIGMDPHDSDNSDDTVSISEIEGIMNDESGGNQAENKGQNEEKVNNESENVTSEISDQNKQINEGNEIQSKNADLENKETESTGNQTEFANADPEETEFKAIPYKEPGTEHAVDEEIEEVVLRKMEAEVSKFGSSDLLGISSTDENSDEALLKQGLRLVYVSDEGSPIPFPVSQNISASNDEKPNEEIAEEVVHEVIHGVKSKKEASRRVRNKETGAFKTLKARIAPYEIPELATLGGTEYPFIPHRWEINIMVQESNIGVTALISTADPISTIDVMAAGIAKITSAGRPCHNIQPVSIGPEGYADVLGAFLASITLAVPGGSHMLMKHVLCVVATPTPYRKHPVILGCDFVARNPGIFAVILKNRNPDHLNKCEQHFQTVDAATFLTLVQQKKRRD